MSDKIVWLAAYPKTGSTWLRTIIQQLLAPGVRGKEAIPSLDRDYPQEAPTYAVMNTEAKMLRTHCQPEHKVFQRMIKQRPDDEVIGVMTIQRHPLDVLLSQLNYSFVLGRKQSFKGEELKKCAQPRIHCFKPGAPLICPDLLGRVAGLNRSFGPF